MDYHTVEILYLEHSSQERKKIKEKKEEIQLLMPIRQRIESISTRLLCLPRTHANY